MALDAKVSLDENALFRQPENRQLELDNKIADGGLRASWDGFNYFRLSGNIGCLTVGAGLAMATLDTIMVEILWSRVKIRHPWPQQRFAVTIQGRSRMD